MGLIPTLPELAQELRELRELVERDRAAQKVASLEHLAQTLEHHQAIAELLKVAVDNTAALRVLLSGAFAPTRKDD